MWPSIVAISGSSSTSRIVSESDVAAALAALERVRNDLATRREDAERSGVPEVPSLSAIIPHKCLMIYRYRKVGSLQVSLVASLVRTKPLPINP